MSNSAMKLKLAFLDVCNFFTIRQGRDKLLQASGYNRKVVWHTTYGASARGAANYSEHYLVQRSDGARIDSNFSKFLEEAATLVSKRSVHIGAGRLDEAQAKKFYPAVGLK